MKDQENGHEHDSGADGFARMWADLGAKMAEGGSSLYGFDGSPESARRVRDAMLKAMGEYSEQYLRSPEFLAAMKQSLSASIDFRRQMNEYLGRVQHEFQGTSRQDVDQIMLSIRHVEQRLVDSMERLADRLDELDRRIETIGAPRSDDRGPAKTASRPRASTRAKPQKKPQKKKPAGGKRRPRS